MGVVVHSARSGLAGCDEYKGSTKGNVVAASKRDGRTTDSATRWSTRVVSPDAGIVRVALNAARVITRLSIAIRDYARRFGRP